jgi:hypothetical protein
VRLDTSQLAPVQQPSRRGGPGGLFLISLGITAAVVAWGYLVYLAIDFGTTARAGNHRAWFLLALATVGAIACLFIAMVLINRFVQRIRGGSQPAAPPPPPGGRRAAR